MEHTEHRGMVSLEYHRARIGLRAFVGASSLRAWYAVGVARHTKGGRPTLGTALAPCLARTLRQSDMSDIFWKKGRCPGCWLSLIYAAYVCTTSTLREGAVLVACCSN